jgi:hypothetical protein
MTSRSRRRCFIAGVCESIKKIVDFRKENNLPITYCGYKSNSESHSYLSHIGFFRRIGTPMGNEPGQIRGNNNYMPITPIKRNELLSANNNFHVSIEKKAEQITQILLSLNRVDSKHEPISHCFQEIIRNVFEHANTDECLLLAQRYKGKEIEIALLDNGRGIRDSLQERFEIENDFEALQPLTCRKWARYGKIGKV